MGKTKLKITIEVDDKGLYIVYDELFYDYGIGNNLKDSLRDYANTLSIRYGITSNDQNRTKWINRRLKILRKILRR